MVGEVSVSLAENAGSVASDSIVECSLSCQHIVFYIWYTL